MCRMDSHERRPFLINTKWSAAASTSSLALQMRQHAIESKKRRLPFHRIARYVRKNIVPIGFACLFFVCLMIGFQIGQILAGEEEDGSRSLRKPQRNELSQETLARNRDQKPQKQNKIVQRASKPLHPYEMIWPGLKLPQYMLKDPQYDIESVPPDKKACFVHVGKTAGSTVGCSIGFNLHCASKVQALGVFPRYTTNMFHAQIYDCDDHTTTYFIFVVRNPLDRWISAFNYDNPSTDWEGFRLQFGEKHFNFRYKLYAECPFNTVNDVGEALSADSNVTDVCKRRAEASIDGTEHFGCHHYFNYQFHLEAIPENATIMTIRTEHLIEDWNSVEFNLGGVTEVLGQDNNVIAHNNVNEASDDKLKYLSNESKRLICEKLCNEIQNYKKILRLSVNLGEEQVQKSVDELMNSCPIEAKSTTCNDPMPNITDKLIYSRGYRDES
jgi:hypothetical protein